MGTPDFIEDLLILSRVMRENGRPSPLDDKLLVGCMQRGGVADIVGEIDDRFGSYTPQSIAQHGLDGGKMMFRAVPDDERSLVTIDYCARAVTELARRGLAAFVEPLPMQRRDGKLVADYSAATMIKYVGVAARFGETSRFTWLKVPHVDGFERVAAATTLPILMLGGESKGDPAPVIQSFARGMRAGANVRGVMVGRNVSFPGSLDPGAVAAAVAAIVHDGAAEQDALEILHAVPPEVTPLLPVVA
jgi:tagatose-1,6-bisphosphate aldolase